MTSGVIIVTWNPDALVRTIARRVSGIRKARGLTLDALAAKAGVSKGSLVNLEKGAGNPSIALLCQTAVALGVSVSDMLGDSAAHPVDEIDLSKGRVLWRGRNGGTARLIAGAEGPDMFEIWDWEMFPGERYDAKPHSRGAREFIYALRGQVGVMAGEWSGAIKPGWGVMARTDTNHAYWCHGRKPVKFRMVVVERPAYDAVG